MVGGQTENNKGLARSVTGTYPPGPSTISNRQVAGGHAVGISLRVTQRIWPSRVALQWALTPGPEALFIQETEPWFKYNVENQEEGCP